jgi:hypothetical protein
VVDYLGRYSHRTALTDGRLLGFDGEQIQLAYKDYRDGDQRKVMTLDAEELLRRQRRQRLHGGTRHLAFSALRAGAPARRLGAAATPGHARPGPARGRLLCTTERPIDSASSMQRAAPTCARSARCPNNRTSDAGCPHQLPMTPAADPNTREPASRRCQPLGVHALVHTPARNTIPYIGQRTTRNTQAPDSGLGQFNNS